MVAPAYSQDHERGELDHLISLDLAGANDGANLFIQPGPIPNPKDTVERKLHNWMCDGSTAEIRAQRLHMAQVAIAYNWTEALASLGLT